MSKQSNIRDLCYSAIFAAIIAAMAQISIPMPAGVPLTLQTLAVMLAGIVLGARRGTISVLIYILLGAVGLPIFAGFKGGLASVTGVTGGFIISFWVISLLAGISYAVSKKSAHPAVSRLILAAGIILGAVLNYAIGVIWFTKATGKTTAVAIAACVLPFIVTDLIKVAIAVIAGPLLNKALTKAGLL